MKEIVQRRDWVLWGLWVLASTVSWSLGLILFRTLFNADSVVIKLLGLLFFGGLVGLAQGIILRYHIPQAGWWVLASAAGIAAGVAACIIVLYGADFALQSFGPPKWITDLSSSMQLLIGGTVLGVVFGGAVGLAQSTALPWHVLDTGWWVLASLAGSVLDGVVVATLIWAGGAGVDPAFVLSYPTLAFWATVGFSGLIALGGPMKGILTGWVLVRHV